VTVEALKQRRVIAPALLRRWSSRHAVVMIAVLLAGVPVWAADLVYPQGQFMNLTTAEKRSYARLDFGVGLRIWPARIVKSDHSAWIVPRTPPLSVWKAQLYPSIYVPPGDYVLVFANPMFWPVSCTNAASSSCRANYCGANLNSLLEQSTVELPWKGAAGERYEVAARLVSPAPQPAVEWAGFGCRYRLALRPGYGIADFCLKQTSSAHGSDAAPQCHSSRFAIENPNAGELLTEPGPETASSSAGASGQAAAGGAQARPAPQEPAWLTVTSSPPGAAIQLNGILFGKTPAKLKLVSGEYSIVVEMPGFTGWKRTLKISAGSAISVDAQLAPAAPPPGQDPSSKSPPPADGGPLSSPGVVHVHF